MSKITLDVDKKDINIVLTILNNLKTGLVKNISVDDKNINTTLKSNKPLQKQPIIDDEFMSVKPTHSKYLSRSAYKEKLSKS